MRSFRITLSALILATASLAVSAQDSTNSNPFNRSFRAKTESFAVTKDDKPKVEDAKETPKTAEVDETAAKDDAKTAAECKFCRWIDLQTATVSFRYRYVKSNQRVTPAINATQPFLPVGQFVQTNQAQQQQHYEFDFKFDKAGRYKIHARLMTGEYFTRSFAEVGWGKVFNGENSSAVLARQFYFSAEPVKGIEFQYGGLGINRGENTENTTYDNDGFITGQRLKIKRPKNVWFDEISITYAYIGDFYTPNFFDRTGRLKKSNYYQYLVGKKFGKRVAISADFTSHQSIGHLREAATINTKELKFIDSVKVEFYQRLDDYRGVKKGSGWGFQVDKEVKDKFSITAGFAYEDYRYNVLTTEKYPARQRQAAQPAGTLTADRMIRGLSPFIKWEYKFTPYTSFFGFMTTDLKKPTPLPFVYNSDHMSIGVQVNVKNILKKAGWL